MFGIGHFNLMCGILLNRNGLRILGLFSLPRLSGVCHNLIRCLIVVIGLLCHIHLGPWRQPFQRQALIALQADRRCPVREGDLFIR